MRRIIALCSVFLIWAPLGTAQKVGTTSLQFLKVMPTARATAMGDAFVTLASGSDGVFWNPSVIANTTSIEVSGTMTLWLFDTKQNAVAAVFPFADFGTIGVQAQFVDYGAIEETRVDQLQFVGPAGNQTYNPGLTGNSFTPTTFLVGLSYARRLTEKFSTGVTIKYASESLYNSSQVTIVASNGVAEQVNTYARVLLFDFGMLYDTGYRSVKIGISVQNFGSQVKFAREAYPAPMAFRLGTAADLIGTEALLARDESNRLTVAYDLFQPNDYQRQMHYGIEYVWKNVLALRGGYKMDYDTEGLTFGGGVQTTLSGYRLAVDYSYGKMSDYLNNVHRISLGVQFP